jgi:ABC-2 type transport system permease protein
VAGLKVDVRAQLSAVALLRWQLFVNSLRSVRGRMNLVSRVIAGLLVAGAAFGGAIGLGAAGWELTRTGQLPWVAVLFWVIFVFWQFFPVMATAFTQNVDTSALLRFPLPYRAYFWVRMIFGALDIATALSLCWLIGLLAGVSAAMPRLIPFALLALAGFVGFNLLLGRTVFAWMEHWLSRRRSREIMGLVFLAMIIGFQFLGPALDRYSKVPVPRRLHAVVRLNPVQQALPPGLAASLLVQAQNGDTFRAISLFGLIVAYSGATLLLLQVRLRQQYRGENPEGTSARSTVPQDKVTQPGWKLPFVSSAVSAVFEKELRYFSRSGPLLFTMIMPMVVVLLLGVGKKSMLGSHTDFFFPIGAGYCLLVMTNIVYNSFGGDGGGIQSLLMAPVSFRQIVFAKNLAQSAVLMTEVAILFAGITVIYHTPSATFIVLTFVWYMFAAPLNFGAGNLLSIYYPKKIDYAVFGRQRASETTIFASLLVQLLAMGLGALAIYAGYASSNMWLSTLILSVLAIPSITAYVILMGRIDGIVKTRREVLATELCKA